MENVFRPLTHLIAAAATMGIAVAAFAQDDFEVKFSLSGKSLTCFLEHQTSYVEALQKMAFISPDLCPNGVSTDISGVLVAEGPTASEELTSAPIAEDALIFLSSEEFKCLVTEATAISISPDVVYSFKPQACLLEVSE